MPKFSFPIVPKFKSLPTCPFVNLDDKTIFNDNYDLTKTNTERVKELFAYNILPSFVLSKLLSSRKRKKKRNDSDLENNNSSIRPTY